ncbi:MAG TPA: S24 family peptidase [Flavobacteriaceae bacterium]|nr:S24 family peptidase [Flavobacteriaceae bacterium]
MQHLIALSIKRMRIIREALGYGVEDFAKKLEYPLYESVEKDGNDIPGILIAKLMSVFSINPLWLYGESNMRFLETTTSTAPKFITLDAEEEEGILMVNQKASAGYSQNIHEGEWYKELPSMRLPLPNYRNATYRGFQVQGDSMLPSIYPGDWVIGKSVPNITELNYGKIHIVVLNDAVVVKQVMVSLENPNTILLRSTNPEYEDLAVAVGDIQELWEMSSKLTFAVDVSKKNTLRKELQESMRNFMDSQDA